MLFLKTESCCPDRIAWCNRFLSLMSEISLRCVGNNKDFIRNENNPSLARDKQEIPVKEEELPKKSKEERGRICSETLKGQCLPNHSYRYRSSSVRQNVLDSYAFKKRETEATNPEKNKFTQALPVILLPSLSITIVLLCENENQTPYLLPYHCIVLVLPKPVWVSCSNRVQLWSSI